MPQKSLNEKIDRPKKEEPTFTYISDILTKKVRDVQSRNLGRVVDLVALTPDRPERYPEVKGLVLHAAGEQKYLEVSGGELLELMRAQTLNRPVDNLIPYTPQPANKQFLLREILYDRQIVDVKGAKVERVNDVQLIVADNRAYLVHVDVGFTGLLRRLGFERGLRALTRVFKQEIKDELISWRYVQPLHEQEATAGRVKINVRQEEMRDLHAGELADILEELDRDERLVLVRTMDAEEAAEVLEEADPKVQTEILRDLHPDLAADILEEMEPAAAADAIEELPEDAQEAVMQKMERQHRETMELLMVAEEKTAAALMTVDFITCSAAATVEQAFAKLRAQAEEVELITYVYCTDEQGKLAGVVSVRDLLLAATSAPLTEVMHPRLASLASSDNYETVAEQFLKYRFQALPVVDHSGKMEGIVTFSHSFDELLPYYYKEAA